MKGFSQFKKFNKININKISNERPIVYRIKNAVGKELYDGIAKRNRASNRLLEHLVKKSEKIPGADKFSIKQLSSIEVAEKLEKKIINKFDPKFNKDE